MLMAVVEREPTAVSTGAPLIELAGVEKVYRMGKVDYRRSARRRPRDRGRRDGRGRRPVGERQDDDPEPDHRDRPADGRRRSLSTAVRLDEMSEEQLAVWRGGNVGIVFQFFQLLPTLSALENAVLPLDFARRGSKRERFERARHNLELVGLGDKLDHLPAELSGGEQQRVAIARSLAADPKLIVGDEPTGNLDTRHRGGDVRAARRG